MNRSALFLSVIVISIANGATGFERKNLPAGSKDGRLILAALRAPVEKELKRQVVIKVWKFNLKNGWAFLNGVPQQANGKPMDYQGTRYKEMQDEGHFDDGISALLRQKGTTWQVITYSIGHTDVVYGDWAAKFGAPAELFK